MGPRPTFGADEPVLEAFLLDFSGDLYDHEVEVGKGVLDDAWIATATRGARTSA